MRVLVCGGRDFTDEGLLSAVLEAADAELCIERLIHGGASGADLMAGKWAYAHDIVVSPYLADWDGLGRKAGPIRNQQMLDEGQPHLVVAFPGGRGTTDMISRSLNAGVPVVVVARRNNQTL